MLEVKAELLLASATVGSQVKFDLEEEQTGDNLFWSNLVTVLRLHLFHLKIRSIILSLATGFLLSE